jgi:uncharacterized membrane protein YvbJ
VITGIIIIVVVVIIIIIQYYWLKVFTAAHRHITKNFSEIMEEPQKVPTGPPQE